MLGITYNAEQSRHAVCIKPYLTRLDMAKTNKKIN